MAGMTEGESCRPAFPFCHSRRVLAGIHGLALLSLHSGGPVWGKTHGFPIKDVGNDRGAITNVGNDRGAITNGGHDGGGDYQWRA